jgi:hypothetical protein
MAAVDGRTGHCPIRQPRHPTVRVQAYRPLEALSSSDTGQSGATPDMYCSLSDAPLTGGSALQRPVPLNLQLLQSTVSRRSRCSTGAPDSPVNCSGAPPEKPESGELDAVRSWCTVHCPVRQTRAYSVSLLL